MSYHNLEEVKTWQFILERGAGILPGLQGLKPRVTHLKECTELEFLVEIPGGLEYVVAVEPQQ